MYYGSPFPRRPPFASGWLSLTFGRTDTCLFVSSLRQPECSLREALLAREKKRANAGHKSHSTNGISNNRRFGRRIRRWQSFFRRIELRSRISVQRVCAYVRNECVCVPIRLWIAAAAAATGKTTSMPMGKRLTVIHCRAACHRS